MIAPGPLTTDAENRPCAISLPQVLLDGYVRDRCPYVGDQAVTGMTLLVSNPNASASVLRSMIVWYAQNQHSDGSIPASPYKGGFLTLFDYNAYWVFDIYDYVLYTGDLSLANEVWPSLLALMNTWYPAQMGPNGLLVNSLGANDYAYIPRTGTTVAYYNAGYVMALRYAAQIASWIGQPSAAAAWKARITPVAAAFVPAFWDPSVRALKDTTTGAVVHPEDGNVFAALAGLLSPQQAVSALDYLGGHEWAPYGATIADNDDWDGYPWGFQADERVYPFIGYFDVVARFEYGLDPSAIALIQREWGYMLSNGPKDTMWETIGPNGGPPVDSTPSYDHGWSSGAAPALTNYALGVQPATPGFGSFVAQPHPAALKWARGTVPTPHGTIAFKWYRAPHGFSATVSSPVPGKLILPDWGVAKLDGKKLPEQWGVTIVRVPKGTNTVVITSAT
jgi:hypothetical protein